MEKNHNNNDKFSKKNFQFKPITKGLGFHVFSDGLPYRPEKNQTPSLPRRSKEKNFEKNNAPSALDTTGVSRTASQDEILYIKNKLNPTPQPSTIIFGKKNLRKQSQRTKELSTHKNNYSFFYLPKRALAFITDTLFHSSVCFFLLFILSQHMSIPFAAIQNIDSLIFASIFIFIFNWALILAEEVAFGFSLGKKIFGLSIEAPPFILLARSLLFLIGLFAFGFGLWIAFFSPEKKAWHDLVTKVQPEEMAEI